ncbi:hypothetical protein [uncultured Pontibacter sp.]|uniref:hypothetical protein n=1 Tax=uncultured Pontibacter sp. TaxID=453356 RepID=UPI0026056F53|nr:hypothetical protein [uncultured Pontibacter sp.]
MNRKAKLSLVFGLFMTFTFTINSLIKGELETAEEIQTTLIAVVAAGIVSSGLLYFFVKDSQVDKIWGKKKEE